MSNLIVCSPVTDWLDLAITQARDDQSRGAELRHIRNKAFLWLGFWRGFRDDELTRLLVEHINVALGEGMTLFFP